MKQNDDENLIDSVCDECGNGSVEYVYGYWWCPNEDCSHHRLYRRVDVLRRLWCEKGLTQEEVSNRLHTSVRTVQRWISRHGISKKQHLQTKWVNGYHILRHKDGEANRKVRIHRLVAVAEYGIDAVKDKDVHHKNGVRWDNRPDNLELLEPDEHGRVTRRENRYDRMNL